MTTDAGGLSQNEPARPASDSSGAAADAGSDPHLDRGVLRVGPGRRVRPAQPQDGGEAFPQAPIPTHARQFADLGGVDRLHGWPGQLRPRSHPDATPDDGPLQRTQWGRPSVPLQASPGSSGTWSARARSTRSAAAGICSSTIPGMDDRADGLVADTRMFPSQRQADARRRGLLTYLAAPGRF